MREETEENQMLTFLGRESLPLIIEHACHFRWKTEKKRRLKVSGFSWVSGLMTSTTQKHTKRAGHATWRGL